MCTSKHLRETPEGTILSLEDVSRVPAGENYEKLVDVRTYDTQIIAAPKDQDMHPYTRDNILVRDMVAKKCALVNAELLTQGLCLRVVCGYRHPQIQLDKHRRQYLRLKAQNPSFTNTELALATHLYVADPSVAGHPTGGAVDVTIQELNGNRLDMGTEIGDLFDSENIPTFTTKISQEQLQLRRMLHDLMKTQHFAPFYGEWWHFSFGDRERACFYHQPSALYASIRTSMQQ